MKDYINERLAKGATSEEIAAEVASILNEIQTEKAKKTERINSLKSIINDLITYVNIYHDGNLEDITDEEVEKFDAALPAMIKFSQSLEKLSTFTFPICEKDNDELTTCSAITVIPKKPESLDELLNEDMIIKGFIDGLLNL